MLEPHKVAQTRREEYAVHGLESEQSDLFEGSNAIIDNADKRVDFGGTLHIDVRDTPVAAEHIRTHNSSE